MDNSNLNSGYSAEPYEQVTLINKLENEIIECVETKIQLSESQKEMLMNLVSIVEFKKGEHIITEGEVNTNCYHVISGCVRRYYVIDGEEKTTFFYTENQSIMSLSGAKKGEPARFNLTCVEDTSMSVMNEENEVKFFEAFPEMTDIARTSMEEEIGNYQSMLDMYITTSPEERYVDLLENRSGLLNRVPQYQLASYLGVKPESLSRIRKRIFLKK